MRCHMGLEVMPSGSRQHEHSPNESQQVHAVPNVIPSDMHTVCSPNGIGNVDASFVPSMPTVKCNDVPTSSFSDGYTNKSHGSVLLDFVAGLIRYQATVGHDVVERQMDAVDEQGTDVHKSVSGVSMVVGIEMDAFAAADTNRSSEINDIVNCRLHVVHLQAYIIL